MYRNDYRNRTSYPKSNFPNPSCETAAIWAVVPLLSRYVCAKIVAINWPVIATKVDDKAHLRYPW